MGKLHQQLNRLSSKNLWSTL